MEIDLYVTSEESLSLLARFNSGEKLNIKELLAMPQIHTLKQITITVPADLYWLTAYAIANGHDLQGLFRTEEYEYQTLFINKENVNAQLESKLNKYGLLDYFQSSHLTGIAVSFPE